MAWEWVYDSERVLEREKEDRRVAEEE